MMDKIPPTSSAQPVVPLPISTVVSTSKPQSHVFVWIAAGVVTLAIGIGIGLAIGKYSSKAQISSYDDCVKAKGSRIQESYPATCVTAGGQRFIQPISTPTVNPTKVVDPTANWKTYTNVKYRFEFKYPNQYEAKEAINPNYLLLVNLNKKQNSVFNISIVTYTKTLDDYLNTQYCVPNGPCLLSAKNSTALILSSGVTGKYFRPPSEGLPAQTFITKVGDLVYKITYVYQEQSIPAGLDPFLDQILSTFKFTN